MFQALFRYNSAKFSGTPIMPSQAARTRTAIYFSLLMVLVAGISAAATKHATDSIPVAVIVFMQNAISLLLCLPVALRRGLGSLKTKRPGMHLTRSLLGVAGFYLCYSAMAHIPLVDAMLLRQSAPLCVPLVAWLWVRQKMPAEGWIPIVVGFIGVVIILRPGSSSGAISIWHLAGFLSAVALAGSMVATFKLALTESSNQILFYYFSLSALCLLPFSITHMPGLSGEQWLLLVGIGIAMYAALWLYTRAYSMAPASAIAPINYLAVVMAGLLGWLIWQEVPDAASLGGSLLVIIGGLVTIYQARERAK